MAILTKPSVLKGVVSQFSLSKTDLLNNSVVSSDPYFSDSDNWYRVNVIYKSSPGTQYEIVEFDATQETPVGNFLISERARDLFEVQKVQIVDFDGGFLEISRNDLTVLDFDIEFTSEPEILPVVTLDFTQGSLPANSTIVSGVAPDMSNASAKFFDSSQINISESYQYTEYSNYTVRFYVKSVSKGSANSIIASLSSLFRSANSTIMEVPPFYYGDYNEDIDLSAKVGSFVEYTFTSGPILGQYPIALNISISPSGSVGSHLEVTKIEIFEGTI